jgi:hypothetical protein
MKPKARAWIGLVTALIGILLLCCIDYLAVAVTKDHLLALRAFGDLLALFPMFFGCWFSGLRIKFKPKRDLK